MKEHGSYDTHHVFLGVLGIGSTRLFLEWVLGGTYILFPPSDLAMAVGYYWLAAYLLAGVLSSTARQPWSDLSRIALFATAFGVLPPILDSFFIDGGFQYGYVWDFPAGFTWVLYNPHAGITAGEAISWWAIVAFMGAYVFRTTRNVKRGFCAAVLAYFSAVTMLAVVPSLAAAIRAWLEWPAGHQRTVLVLLLALGAASVYMLVHRALLVGLLRRIQHAFPFVMFCLVGSAFAGRISESTFVYAFLLLLTFTAALAQNDLHDKPEDGLQGRKPYAGNEDVRLLNLVVGYVIFVLAGTGTLTSIPLLIVFITTVLYSYPFYRAKRFFPSNLKMEGMWGLSSFTLGLVAAIEHKAYGAPRWWLAGLPSPQESDTLGAFNLETLFAMLLVFAGYSLVAMLKDYKDWEADNAAGIQTVYTLAHRKGWQLERVHSVVLTLSAASLLAAPVLLAAGQLLSWVYAGGGLVAAGALWLLMAGSPSPQSFRRTLYLLTLYFLYLALALSFPFPGGQGA